MRLVRQNPRYLKLLGCWLEPDFKKTEKMCRIKFTFYNRRVQRSIMTWKDTHYIKRLHIAKSHSAFKAHPKNKEYKMSHRKNTFRLVF